MPILSVDDKDLYFPDVCQTGTALENLILRAENFVQSGYGSDRPLERKAYVEYRDWGVNSMSMRGGLAQQWSPHWAGVPVSDSTLWLNNAPVELVDPAPVIRYQGSDSKWGRLQTVDWEVLSPDYYDLSAEGRLNIASSFRIRQLEISYTAGFDFAVETSDTITIKIATGMILVRLARTDPDATRNQDLTLEPFQDWIKTVLMPIQKYRRRGGVG